jgi:2-amino-4-hydroxy-6-hydroxymethyldihydropteridine diphosphokinase
MVEVCLSLGSNIAPAENLKRAVELLREKLPVRAVSRAWKSPAVGSGGPDYLNAAVLVDTWLYPRLLKEEILRPIERSLGRRRGQDKYAPRTIDIDIVTYDGKVLDPQLWTQAYLALPVAELLPGLVNPNNGDVLEDIAHRLVSLANVYPSPDVLEGE